MIKAVKDILEKKILEYCCNNKRVCLLFDEEGLKPSGKLLVIGYISNPSKDTCTVAQYLKKQDYFTKDHLGNYRINELGRARFEQIKDLEWDPHIPDLRDGDMDYLKRVTNRWQTPSEMCGSFEYKYSSIFVRLAAHGHCECLYFGKVRSGKDVYLEPELKVDHSRSKRKYRIPSIKLTS